MQQKVCLNSCFANKHQDAIAKVGQAYLVDSTEKFDVNDNTHWTKRLSLHLPSQQDSLGSLSFAAMFFLTSDGRHSNCVLCFWLQVLDRSRQNFTIFSKDCSR